MTKIYLAENFLEADQIISELEANHSPDGKTSI